MPDRYPAATANKPRDTTPARRLRQDAMPTGVFRCDRCDRVVPESLLVVQDGYSFCRTLCADLTSVTEITQQLAADQSVTDSYAPNIDPPTNAFDGAVAITSTPTWPVHLVSGGASVALAFGGVGFTSSIAISYSNAGITDNTAPVITSTAITLDLVAAGVTAGYYNITIAGKTYYRVLQVV